MRFPYTKSHPLQNDLDSLPRLPLTLVRGQKRIDVMGLVDSGATVNVLPYQMGVDLGATWDDSRATMRLAGNLGKLPALPIILKAEIESFAPVNLAFTWSQSNDVPLILGQMNFFLNFEVRFYRWAMEFEVLEKG